MVGFAPTTNHRYLGLHAETTLPGDGFAEAIAIGEYPADLRKSGNL
jgi:hypothetical protein